MYDPQTRTFTVAGCFVLQSLLKMLQTGDRIVADLRREPERRSTHPDPKLRLLALREVMGVILPHNSREFREVEMYAWFLVNFLDLAWNRSIGDLIGHLQKQEGLATRSVSIIPGAELRFL